MEWMASMATAWQTVSMNYSSALSVPAQRGFPNAASSPQLSFLPIPCLFFSSPSPLPSNSYLVFLLSLSTYYLTYNRFSSASSSNHLPTNGLEYFLGHTQGLTNALLVVLPSPLLSSAFFLVQVSGTQQVLPPTLAPALLSAKE